MATTTHESSLHTFGGIVIFAFLLSLSVSLSVQSLHAQEADIVELNLEGISKSKSLTRARREILNSTMKNAARMKIIELIGEQKFTKHRSLIDTLILKQVAKYIPVATPGKLNRRKDGTYSMAVGLKFSMGSLKSILQKNGLLYDRDGPAKILPMIVWQDRVNSVNFSWWYSGRDNAKSFLIQLDRQLDQALYEEFSLRGFYVYRPMNSPMNHRVPQAFLSENLQTSDYMFFGDFYKSDIITRGYVRIESSQNLVGASLIKIKLVSIQSENGRTIAEISRSLETETGQFEMTVRGRLQSSIKELAQDLAVQVQEAWEKGTFGANLLQIAIRGSMQYQELNQLKSYLMKESRQIKSVRERFLGPSETIFEVDYKGGAQELAQLLSRLDGQIFPYQVSRIDSQKIVLDQRKN